MATTSPGLTARSIPPSTGASGRVGYENVTPSNSTRPSIAVSSTPPEGGIAGVRSSSSKIRSAAPLAFMKSAQRSVSPPSESATSKV